jgi:hypothetical protein
MKRPNDRRVGSSVRTGNLWLKWKWLLRSCVFGATLGTPMLATAAAPDPDASGPVAPSTGSPTEEAGRDFSQTSYQPGWRESPREREETPAAQSDFMPAGQEAVRVRAASASQSEFQPGAAESR